MTGQIQSRAGRRAKLKATSPGPSDYRAQTQMNRSTPGRGRSSTKAESTTTRSRHPTRSQCVRSPIQNCTTCTRMVTATLHPRFAPTFQLEKTVAEASKVASYRLRIWSRSSTAFRSARGEVLRVRAARSSSTSLNPGTPTLKARE